MQKFFFISLLFIKSLNAQGYICAVGGGSEDYGGWSDEPYGWMVDKADSGKVIILSYGDATSWLPNYFVSLGASSAYNKKISSRYDADLQATYDELITARAIFLRGGDQWQYVKLWKGTKTEDAIKYLFENGGVVGGTSAGAMVLGDVCFSAQFASPDSKSALMNPASSSISLEDNFLKLIPNVLVDTHVAERGRQGRLIAMLYRYFKDANVNIIGAGVDDKTAFCIDNNSIGEVMGTGSVSIFTADQKTLLAEIENDYTIENLKCDQLTDGWKYNLVAKQISYIPPSAKPVDAFRPDELPVTGIWLTGSNNIPIQLSYSLNMFLSTYHPSLVTVISYPSYSANVDAIYNYLVSNSYTAEKLLLTSSTLSDDSSVQKINSADAFIFAGDDPSHLNLLNDTLTFVGEAFKSKMIDGVPVFMFGSSGKTTGKYFVDNTDVDNYAAYEGRMTLDKGLNIFGDFIFQPMVYANNNFYENRAASVLWGLMSGRKRFGVYLDGYDLLKISSPLKTISSDGVLPLFVVDASDVTFIDSSKFRMSGGIAPRQVVAMNNLRYSLTSKNGLAYSLFNKKFDYASGVKKSSLAIKDFILFQNYPNPFNPETKIKFTLPEFVKVEHAPAVHVTIKVYNILGGEISTLFNDELFPGTYQVTFDGVNYPSGVYFCRFTSERINQTIKMILLR